MSSYPKLKLTYFDGPGRAEATRLALFIAGIPFEDERLTREHFAQRKPTFVYGQLPVLQVDGVEIAQSEAILRYAGKLSGLYPVNDPLAALQVDEILAGFEEMGSKIMPTFMEQDEEKKKAMRAELASTTIPRYLNILDGRLAAMKQNPVFQADQLFIHELIVSSQLMLLTSGFLDGIPTTIADEYTEIQAANAKVAAHPKVQQWRAMHAKPGQPKIKLTYFDGPGRAEPVRLAFAIGGIEFEDERVDHDKLQELKPSLPFGQLPVLDVDGKVVAQSLPLLRYAGTLAGLYPTNDPLLAFRADEIVSFSDDVFAAAIPVLHQQDAEKRAEAAKTLVETTLPRIIANLDKRIASWGGPYAVGKTLTIADLIVYSLVLGFKMYTKRGLPEMSLDAFENVNRVYAQVHDHEKVQAWNAQHTA